MKWDDVAKILGKNTEAAGDAAEEKQPEKVSSGIFSGIAEQIRRPLGEEMTLQRQEADKQIRALLDEASKDMDAKLERLMVSVSAQQEQLSRRIQTAAYVLGGSIVVSAALVLVGVIQ